MALIWTEGAIGDLEHIRRYLGALRRQAETRLSWTVIDVTRRLDAADEHPSGCRDVPLLDPFVMRVHGEGSVGFVLSIRQRGGAIR